MCLYFVKPLFLSLIFIQFFALGKQDFRTVTKLVDGDTFWVNGKNGIDEKIRLIGIDAHETRNTPHKAKGSYGQAAAKYLRQLILKKKVRLEYDVQKKDRYGRTLAYAYLENGVFINAHLVKYGYASVLTVVPNVKFAEKLYLYQYEAREKKRGMWAIQH